MSLPAYANNQQSFPAMYEQWLVGPLFRPWAEVLLDAPAARRPATGCSTSPAAPASLRGWRTNASARRRGRGSGRQSRHAGGGAGGRAGHHLARRQRPRPAARRGRALRRGDLPAGPAVLPRSPGAARQMRRALAPGGRLGVATWRPAEEIPMFHAAAGRGRTSSRTDRRSTPRLRRRRPARRAAGGRRLRRRRRWTRSRARCASTTARVRADEHDGAGRDVGRGQGDERRGPRCRRGAAIVADSAEVLAAFSDGAAAVFDISSNVAIGRG